MKKITLLFILFSFVSLHSFSQMVLHSTMNVSGASFTNSNVKLKSSIGQLLNTNYFHSGINFNEGILQQSSGVPLTNELNDVLENKASISIFPTPATDFVYISNNDNSNLEYQIFNMHGQLAAQGLALKQIDTSILPNGIYYLKFLHQNGNLLYSTKFIKS